MNFPSSIIKNAVEAISNFPGIGKKTALRLVIYLLRQKKIAYNISESIKILVDQTTYCSNCFNISKTHLCDICNNVDRDKSVICVVEDVRDIIYIDDFVDGLVNVMDKCEEKYEVINIGSNESYSINQILKKCMEIENYNVPIEHISGKPSMIPIRKISSDKMKEKYDWKCKYTLEQGLRNTITWYKEKYHEK